MLRKLLIVFTALLFTGAAAYSYFIYSPAAPLPPLSGKAELHQLKVGERDRTFWSYVPQNLSKGAPLVVVLHGSLMNGGMMRRFTGYEFDVLADAKGFAVAYPDGYKGAWNECRKIATTAAKRENIDDVGFIKTLIADFVSQHGTAPDKVYAFGYSNGGQMAYRLAFETPALLQAFATVGSNLPVDDNTLCPTTGATPRGMLVSGTEDPLVPFNGGETTLFGFASRGFVISARATAEALVKRNAPLAMAVVQTLPHHDASDPTSVEAQIWSRDDRAFVSQYVVKGGGHVVPQPAFRFPRLFGKTTGDLDAPAEAVSFFLK